MVSQNFNILILLCVVDDAPSRVGRGHARVVKVSIAHQPLNAKDTKKSFARIFAPGFDTSDPAIIPDVKILRKWNSLLRRQIKARKKWRATKPGKKAGSTGPR